MIITDKSRTQKMEENLLPYLERLKNVTDSEYVLIEDKEATDLLKTCNNWINRHEHAYLDLSMAVVFIVKLRLWTLLKKAQGKRMYTSARKFFEHHGLSPSKVTQLKATAFILLNLHKKYAGKMRILTSHATMLYSGVKEKTSPIGVNLTLAEDIFDTVAAKGKGVRAKDLHDEMVARGLLKDRRRNVPADEVNDPGDDQKPEGLEINPTCDIESLNGGLPSSAEAGKQKGPEVSAKVDAPTATVAPVKLPEQTKRDLSEAMTIVEGVVEGESDVVAVKERLKEALVLL